MMYLWNRIDRHPWRERTKYTLLLALISVIAAVIGLAAWLLIRGWWLSSIDWAMVFVGYPVVVGWFAVFFTSCRHDFHDGESGRED